jgi:hypothetical protein
VPRIRALPVLLTLLIAIPAVAGSPATLSTLTPEEATALTRKVAARVEAIRGLEFLKEVPVEVVDDAAARRHFQQRFEALMPPERLAAQSRAYGQLGLLPPDLNLVDLVFDLLEEQAGGYYDPDVGTFFLLDDMPAAIAPLLIAHELTHALDDQHFRIDEIFERHLDDDDRTAAISAVVEGSGTLVMTMYSTQEIMARRITPEDLAALQETEAGKAERMLAAPPVLQRALLAPYLLGQVFLVRGNITKMLTGPDMADVDRAFRSPPESFEQILHPEKYWSQEKHDPPRRVELPDLAAVLGAGWTVRGRGTLGELDAATLTGAGAVAPDSIQAVSAAAWTNEAAAGWGGDRWVLLSDGTRWVTVLATLWDTEGDALEFMDAVDLDAFANLSRRRDAVVVVAGEPGDRAPALAGAVLDVLAPAAGAD